MEQKAHIARKRPTEEAHRVVLGSYIRSITHNNLPALVYVIDVVILIVYFAVERELFTPDTSLHRKRTEHYSSSCQTSTKAPFQTHSRLTTSQKLSTTKLCSTTAHILTVRTKMNVDRNLLAQQHAKPLKVRTRHGCPPTWKS